MDLRLRCRCLHRSPRRCPSSDGAHAIGSDPPAIMVRIDHRFAVRSRPEICVKSPIDDGTASLSRGVCAPRRKAGRARVPARTAAVRFETPSLALICTRWRATVRSLMNRRSPMSRLRRPRASCESTSSSRADRPAVGVRRAPRAGRDAPADRAQARLGAPPPAVGAHVAERPRGPPAGPRRPASERPSASPATNSDRAAHQRRPIPSKRDGRLAQARPRPRPSPRRRSRAALRRRRAPRPASGTPPAAVSAERGHARVGVRPGQHLGAAVASSRIDGEAVVGRPSTRRGRRQQPGRPRPPRRRRRRRARGRRRPARSARTAAPRPPAVLGELAVVRERVLDAALGEQQPGQARGRRARGVPRPSAAQPSAARSSSGAALGQLARRGERLAQVAREHQLVVDQAELARPRGALARAGGGVVGAARAPAARGSRGSSRASRCAGPSRVARSPSRRARARCSSPPVAARARSRPSP